jgi:hypothetical protein
LAFFIQKPKKIKEMSKYKNSIIPINVLSGANSNSVTINTEAGYITRAIIVSQTPNNPGMVRATIEGNNGEKLAEMQALEIFRSRETEYEKDGVPVNVHGGGAITFKILATKNFDADFNADLVLVYGKETPCDNY